MFSRAAISGALAVLLSTSTVSASYVSRGLGWATDNRYAPTIGNLPLIDWFHHWQDGPISNMPSKVEYVPMFWGSSKWDLWNSRKAEMNKNLPKNLLSFNEPDLSGQANMSPDYAAQVWMQEIHPWGKKGVKLGSPAIAYNLDWMASFLKALQAKGGYVDFICIHWYGSWNDLAGFKSYVQSAHSKFGKDIWIPELGITSASKPTQAQAKNFMEQAFTWMDSLGYVKRAAWFGCFLVSSPPDSYATAKNALFSAPYQLADIAYYYGYSHGVNKRAITGGDKVARHNRIAAIAARQTESEDDDGVPPVHCDDICKARQESIKEYLDSTPGAREFFEAEAL